MRSLCVDTSFLIDLWIEYYPPKHSKQWASLWEEVIPGLIQNELFFAPHEVFEELSGKEASLKKWAYKNRKMFIVPNKAICSELTNILKNCPNGVDRYKRGPHADPLVVALAKTTGAIAVTRERRDGSTPSQQKPRVHTLCSKNDVDCYVTVNEFREHINWPRK